MAGSIRVVVADDSPFVRRLLKQWLESDPSIEVVGMAANGDEAMDRVGKLKPDVVTLDVNMPGTDGLEALGVIMSDFPTAVILISGVGREEARITEIGLSLGAVDFILKYSPDKMIPPGVLQREIISKVRAAARIKVIRNVFTQRKRTEAYPFSRGKKANLEAPGRIVGKRPGVVVIGASTGGPIALRELLRTLPERFPFPVIVVQHMPGTFTRILAGQLDRMFPFDVREATDGDRIMAGTVLVAPGNRHLLLNPDGSLSTSDTPAINGYKPSIDVTMQSASHAFGSQVLGVVLSGMGNDGMEGMKAIHDNRGMTFAQNSESCVIDSMPKAAIGGNYVQHIGTPKEIGGMIMSLGGNR